MIVHFFEPPCPQKIGGLELAIRSLEAFLKSSGVQVRKNSPMKALDRNGNEVVHFHGLWQPKFLKISSDCRRRGIPYIVSVHGMLEPWAFHHKRWKKWPYFHFFEKRHLTSAARLFATSENEAENIQKLLPSAAVDVLPLGLPDKTRPDYVAARAALGWNDSEFVFLFLSRIHPKKGLDLLLEALANVDPAALQRTRLVIVGGGESAYVQELKSFHESNRSRLPKIDWAGEIWSADKWKYFQGADLFCLPSHSENFGLAVLEALQVGTRVLTTNQTPWRGIRMWSAGYVVEVAHEAILFALKECLIRGRDWSLEQRNSLADKIHTEFSWDTVGPRYVRSYTSIVRGNRGSSRVSY